MRGLLDETDLLVKHRPKLLERRVGYDVYGLHENHLGSVVQVGRDNLEKMLHPQRSDNAQTAFEMTDAAGDVVLRLTHVQALRSSLVVGNVDRSEVGRIRLQKILGKSRFDFEVAGVNVGAINAATWRKRRFVILDGAGEEIAGIDMTRGSSGDHAHHNEYAVHIHRHLADPLRALTVVAVVGVDMILWER